VSTRYIKLLRTIRCCLTLAKLTDASTYAVNMYLRVASVLHYYMMYNLASIDVDECMHSYY
jgi:hypothetical protein